MSEAESKQWQQFDQRERAAADFGRAVGGTVQVARKRDTAPVPEQITRPKVTVTTEPKPEGERWAWHNAACAHCSWTYRNVAKTDVEDNAKRHRAAHREGKVR